MKRFLKRACAAPMSRFASTPLAPRVASLNDIIFGVGMTLLAYDVVFPKDADAHDTLMATFIAPFARAAFARAAVRS